MNKDIVWAIATGTSAHITAMESHLPKSVHLYSLRGLPARSAPDLILLDLLHPMASPSEVLGEVERHAHSFVIILTKTVENLEGWPLSNVRVSRVIKHPKTAAGFKNVVQKILPFAEKTTTPQIMDATYSAGAIHVLFSNGKTFDLPLKDIEGLDDTAIEKVHVSKQRYDFEIVQDSGNTAVVPWDLVLYHCDSGYEYYKRKESPSLADRVAANIRTLRDWKGWTSYELADRTGIKRPNIARIENAKGSPSLPTLDRIADALGVPVTKLLE